MNRLLTMALCVAVIAVSTPAIAAKVFFNGKEITPYLKSLEGKSFEKVTVRVDANGDVRIEAPQYKVDFEEPAAAPAAAAPAVAAPALGAAVEDPDDSPGGANAALQTRYYLVTKPSTDGKAQYDFLVYVNGQKRKTVAAGSSQIIVEISAWLQPGDNEIKVVARKATGNGRLSYSPQDVAKLLIGRGHEEGKIVKIDALMHSVSVSAAQTTNITKHFQLTAH